MKQMGRLLSEIKGGGQGQAISKSGEMNVDAWANGSSTHRQMVLQMSRKFYAWADGSTNEQKILRIGRSSTNEQMILCIGRWLKETGRRFCVGMS